MRRSLQAKETAEQLANDGVAPAAAGGTPDKLRALIAAEIAQWRKVVDKAQIKLE